MECLVMGVISMILLFLGGIFVMYLLHRLRQLPETGPTLPVATPSLDLPPNSASVVQAED